MNLDDRFEVERATMVAEQLEARGIRDARVLEAFRLVPRHAFIEERYWHDAYGDHPVSIGYSATISQPYMVAVMLSVLEVQPDCRVLEVGTGTGYQAALLASLAEKVVTIERVPQLADAAREILKQLGIDNVEVLTGDGTLGAPQRAPFDRIVVAAAAPYVPEPLFDQLAEGGKLLIPVGPETQELLRITRVENERRVERLGLCRFVPLIGEEGHPAD